MLQIIVLLFFSVIVLMVRKNVEPFVNIEPPKKPKIGIVSMIKNPKNIETWLEKHRTLGISKFYIRLEDTPDVEKFLLAQPDVYVKSANSTGVNEYTDIQRRQGDWVNEAVQMSKNEIEWIIHIDSDEILDGTLDGIYALPDDVHTFSMKNIEAVYDDIPTEEENCFRTEKFFKCAEPPYKCVSYANGKGGGRTKYATFHGPHRFQGQGKEVELTDLQVKHYESCDFNTYTNKFRQLAKKAKLEEIPFPYYKDSIKAANQESDKALKCVFRKYRTEKNESLECETV